MLIRAKKMYDGLGSVFEDMAVTVDSDKICAVTNWDDSMTADYCGFVTPAFIDAHCHIGMERHGEPSSEEEDNDITSQIMPLNNPLFSVYFDDESFSDVVDWGVLYSCIVPGSANLIGGKAFVIRNFARDISEAALKDYGYKMALGYNPRSTTELRGVRPNTRMGIYQYLEKNLDDVLAKREKQLIAKDRRDKEIDDRVGDGKLTMEQAAAARSQSQREHELEFSAEERALLEIIDGDKIAKVHVHKADDIEYLFYLKRKYKKIRVTAEHCCDVFDERVFVKLAAAGIPVVYGPIGSIGGKVELKNASYKNTELLINSGVQFGLMTDHPVLHSYTLRDCLKYFLVAGMSEADAIALITGKNAAILGVDDTIGSIEPGKTASIIVWDKEPLSLAAYPLAVIAEGEVVR